MHTGKQADSYASLVNERSTRLITGVYTACVHPTGSRFQDAIQTASANITTCCVRRAMSALTLSIVVAKGGWAISSRTWLTQWGWHMCTQWV
jgi:hypothetical protein